MIPLLNAGGMSGTGRYCPNEGASNPSERNGQHNRGKGRSMKPSQIGLRLTYVLATCFVLGACSGVHNGVPAATSISSDSEPTRTRWISTATSASSDSEPTKTRRVPTATPVPSSSEPTKTGQGPTPTRQSPTLAITCRPSDEVRLVQITDGSVDRAYWSENGQSVIYGTGYDEGGRKIRTWWEYNVGQDDLHRVAPPTDMDDRVLEQLGARRRVQISPSGDYALYMRVSPGYENYTPEPEDGPWGPPVEVWAAQSDGNRSWRLYGPDGSCRTLGDVVWLDRERKVVFSCGYEGPPMVLVAQVDGSSVIGLGAMTAFTDSLGYAGMALSPDETMLALTGQFGNLQIVPLDGTAVRHIARYGFSPSWSLDSRRVYYMRTEKEWGDSADVYMYDLDIGTGIGILPSPLCTPDGTELHLLRFPLAVSPSEKAAVVFASGSLWLVTWSR